jgi:hypothetical protein
MKTSVTLCDVCGSPLGHRSVALCLDVVVRNGHEGEAHRDFPDLCGIECAHAALNKLLTDAERGVGGRLLSGASRVRPEHGGPPAAPSHAGHDMVLGSDGALICQTCERWDREEEGGHDADQ